jgi:hypothetical protein
MNIFRTQWTNASLYELLALFSGEHRVLGRLRLIQRHEGHMELVEATVESTDLL